MEDFGIVYIIENAQQFWSGTFVRPVRSRCVLYKNIVFDSNTTELEDILRIPEDASLGQLDAALSRFVSFCATYHG